MNNEIHAVTGAFGYSGKYIARRLLDRKKSVITFTNSPNRENEFNRAIKAFPYCFDDPKKLEESLRGVTVLYNTYWVRFNHTTFRHSTAVDNLLILIAAAKAAGVRRIVHISITNPSRESHLEYFSGKALVEEALINSGVSYCILRPTVLFGKEDILINNIAWAVRKFPVIGVFGDGAYKLQPIFVDDLAEIAVNKGEERTNEILDAIGPETYTYRCLVRRISRVLGLKRLIVATPPVIAYMVGMITGWLVGDIMVTREEIEGLMENLLYTKSAPLAKTKLSHWLRENKNVLGKKYASELGRRKDLVSSYENIV
ncbi:MAG: NAD(P)H-binding protein [Candidatus Riflebacteria bacterium]|nr:NAD(P)H-binding protein [Candidatus Riflebacteria bacterium]